MAPILFNDAWGETVRPKVMAVKDKERLVEKLVRQLSTHPDVVFALLHGSFVEDGPFRDIDVVVYLDPQNVTPDRFRSYEGELAAELELQVNLPVDVRVFNDAALSFRYHALKGRTILLRDETLLDDLRARTWDEYLDFAPFARRYLKEALSG